MLYREIIAVCSQIHTKHINTLCGQNVELPNVKPGPKGLNATKHVTCMTAVLCSKAGNWNAPLDRKSIMNIAIHPGRKSHMSQGCQCSHVFDKPCEIHFVTTMEATCV